MMYADNSLAKTGSNNRQHTMELIEKLTGRNAFVGLSRVLVDFMEGDFVAATVLNQILYWSDRTSNPNGYFWKTYKQWKEELGFGKSRMMRVIYGDSRTKTRKKILLDVGVEVVHQKAPNGLRVNHYRLNQPLFFAQLVDFLEANYGESQPEDNEQSVVDSSDDAVLGIAASTTIEQSNDLCDAGADHQEDCNANLPKYASQTPPSTQSKLLSLAKNTESNNSSIDGYPRERDLSFLRQHQIVFGKLTKNLIKKLKKQIIRLGEEQTKEIIQRCREYGKSWHYVLKALRNENSISGCKNTAENSEELPEIVDFNSDWEEQQRLIQSLRPPSPIINDRIRTLQAPDSNTSLKIIWQLAQDRLNADRNFGWRLAQVTFVDFIPENQELIFAANDERERDFCIGHRLFDVAIRDSFGSFGIRNYKITIYTAKEWNDMQQTNC